MTPAVEAFVKEHIIPTRLITCILPDDGTHRKLIKTLSEEKVGIENIQIADSTGCRGQFVSISDKKVSNGSPMQMVQLVVKEAAAESLFRHICELSNIGRPNGGYVLMGEPICVTPYSLPENMPSEEL